MRPALLVLISFAAGAGSWAGWTAYRDRPQMQNYPTWREFIASGRYTARDVIPTEDAMIENLRARIEALETLARATGTPEKAAKEK
jgi:hypothetical protein